jgi:hypothetical protein
LFSFRGTPAVLLYREDFFSQDGAEAPAIPLKRMWGLAENSLEMIEMDAPAFSALPAEEGWDLDALRLGRDGNWYYRGLRKEGARGEEQEPSLRKGRPDVPPELRYFRTADLSVPGEFVSVGLFRTAMTPYTKSDMPFPIREVMDGAGRMAGGEKQLIAAVVSPDFPSTRYFSLQSEVSGALGEPEEPVELAGYYQAPDRAAVVFPDGRGVYVRAKLPSEAALSFALPPLPEGFVYTRIGFVGTVLIAGWEEQQDWLVGAAGFMVINGPWN